MAHYALLDENNIVTKVIVGRDEVTNDPDAPPEMINYWEEYYGDLNGKTCKRTSYNTLEGEHLDGGIPYRKNYAGIGYTYDSTRDAFIPPKPYNSWTLNESTCSWQPPIAQPQSSNEIYGWDEDTLSWVVIHTV